MFAHPTTLPAADIAALCRRFGVVRLELFGSAGTERFRDGHSDHDFIVRFDDAPGRPSLARRFVGLSEALENLLGTSVDLMTDHPVDNPYLRASIDATRRVVYEQSAAQASV